MPGASEQFQSYLEVAAQEFPPAFTHAARLIKSYVIDYQEAAPGEFPPRLLAPFTLEAVARPRRSRPKRPASRSTVLVVFSPDRPDYRELFVPIIEELKNRDTSVSAVVPSSGKTDSSHLANVEVFSFQAFAGATEYRKARAAYSQLRPSIARFGTRFALSSRQRVRLVALLQSYCWSAELCSSALEAVRPRVLLGIHFVSMPGLMGGLEAYRAAGHHVPLLLMQHGHFSHTWESHDFHGADHVLLWGAESQAELRKFPGEVPASTVVGNTKLASVLTYRGHMRQLQGLPTVLAVGTNGPAERERWFLRTVATAFKNRGGVRVLFRPHPAQSADLFLDLVSEGLVEQRQIEGGSNLYAAIAEASVVVGTDSTAMLESLVLGVPVIQMLDRGPSEWARRGVLSATDEHSLWNLAAELLADPARRGEAVASAIDVAHGTIGDPSGAANRVADSIEAVARHDAPRRTDDALDPATRISMGQPLVTIMIPTYDQGDVLPRAIESALAQDYENLEVLVVDDASPDETTASVVARIDDHRLRFIRHAQNLGRVGTYRDTLRHEAKGDFVLNLDGDDWLHDSTFVSSAMRMVDASPDLSLVFGRILTFDDATGAFMDNRLNQGLPSEMEGLDVALGYADDSAGVPHLAAIYDRRKALEAGFYESDIIGSDSLSILKLLLLSRVGFIDRPVAVWRHHGANASRRASVAELLANFIVADEPARLMAESGAVAERAAVEWRRRVSVNLAYPELANLIATGRVTSGVEFLLRMAWDRPIPAARTIARVARTVGRKWVVKLHGAT